VTSREVHRQLRQSLGGWFRAQGFRTTRHAPLGWFKPPLLVWFQCHPHGWDRYSGSSFFVNFQASGSDRSWDGPTRRLQEFLTDEELERLRKAQNTVIPKLMLPPREHVHALRAAMATFPDAEAMLDAYLSGFTPVEDPYRRNQDVSLRYWDADDVAMWASFMLPLLPRVGQTVLEPAAAAAGENEGASRSA